MSLTIALTANVMPQLEGKLMGTWIKSCKKIKECFGLNSLEAKKNP
jgi:hypothetical protein